MIIKYSIKGVEQSFTVIRRAGQKRIIITPQLAGGYRVTAPKHVRKQLIIETIQTHEKTIEVLKPMPSLYTRFVIDKKLPYFGSMLTLSVTDKGLSSIEGDCLFLYVKNTQIETIEKALKAFLKQRIDEVIEDLVRKYDHVFPEMNATRIRIRTRWMKTKFGSCQPRTGHMTLNLELVHYPPHFLTYIFLHEITHLKHPDHSASFYQTLESLYPTHRQDKTELQALRKRLYAESLHTGIT